jgi:GTPase Era involved in 16S rRNA processing
MGGHSSHHHHHYETRYIVSPKSKEIMEQNALEEKNRKEASEELPKILGIVQNEFSTKLNRKISKVKVKIEKELSIYSPSNLKIFIQNLVEDEKIEDKLIADSKKESEIILQHSYSNTNHFNILILGKTGVGKSTLINGIFDFSENEGAKTGDGKPITQEFEEFTSENKKGLRFIDSKGIEMGEHN